MYYSAVYYMTVPPSKTIFSDCFFQLANINWIDVLYQIYLYDTQMLSYVQYIFESQVGRNRVKMT